MESHPIGVFDSGYGGLTVLKEFVEKLPQQDFIYLGDNARAPYGSRSFDSVYRYTRECVDWFFEQGCLLVILACNTASAKALRTIQQHDLPKAKGIRRVLGVIRPTSELVGDLTRSGDIGILATNGTVLSGSYPLEIKKFFPQVRVFQQAAPLWVPLIENNELEGEGAAYFVKKYVHELMEQSSAIDSILLACTHYPLMMQQIAAAAGPGVRIISQGPIVAVSLVDYLDRHRDILQLCSKSGKVQFFTTDSAEDFNRKAGIFYGSDVSSTHVAMA